MTDFPAVKKYFTCQKNKQEIPISEPKCAEPTLYCKYRHACPIFEMEKEARREARASAVPRDDSR